MDIQINGESRHFPDCAGPFTVAALVAELGYAGKRIAVELNGDIVPRSQHSEARLASGDRVEIVVAVGGG